jgi:hypothetical protein
MNAVITESLKTFVSTLTNAEADKVLAWIRQTGIKAVTVEYVEVTVEYVEVSIDSHPFCKLRYQP